MTLAEELLAWLSDFLTEALSSALDHLVEVPRRALTSFHDLLDEIDALLAERALHPHNAAGDPAGSWM